MSVLFVDACLRPRGCVNLFSSNSEIITVLQFLQFLSINLKCCYRYVDVIEQAVVAGDTVLIENLEETIDPVIDPLLGRHTIKKGR